jgi:serine protease Do
MNRTIGSWKLLILSVVLGAPVGYWLFSNNPSRPSAVYAQQVVESQQARGGLDRGGVNIAGADQLSKVFRDVSKSLKPSVVSIKNVVERSVRGRSRGNRGLPPELEQFFGGQIDGFGIGGDEGDLSPKGRFENGLGSGVIVRSDGYILTNNHVVEGASVLEVVLSDDRKMEAKVIGTDERTDLAVLKIEATGLVAAQLGKSADMEVGDWVIAIGSPFGLAQTVTAGIVSATDRSGQDITPYDSFIQTDAAINPGNSGGPLLNLRGEVIGINTAIASKSGGYNGICFAVPSDTAKRILEDLISKGKVTRGVIGVRPVTLTPQLAEKLALPSDQRGALVESVNKDFPADKAGIQKGDVITAINGQPIVSDSGMRRAIGETKPGTRIRVALLRNGKASEVEVVVEELDERTLVAGSGQTIQALGVIVGEVSSELMEEFGLNPGQGVEIKGVNRNSPLAGLVPPGVVVLSVNGKKIDSPAAFAEAIEEASKKGAIKIVFRDAEADKAVQLRMR